MVNVAKEMQRRGMDLPLLIGGATTSRQHTAVRIAPAYEQPVVHVLDASRVVGVVSALLDPERKSDARRPRTVELQDRLRAQHAERERTPLLPYRMALANRTPIDWRADDIAAAVLHGPPHRRARRSTTLREFIDWTFFFTAWELKGRFPQILDHPQHGEAARELYEHANELLDEIVGRGLDPGPRRLRLLAGRGRGRRHRAGQRRDVPDAASAGRQGRATGRTDPSRTSSRRPSSGSPTTSGRSR